MINSSNISNITNISNINNLLLCLTNVSLNKSGLQNLESNNSQGQFSKLISMMLGCNVGKQAVVTDSVISSEDIANLIESNNQDDKQNNQTNEDYKNLMNIISGITQNPTYIDLDNMNLDSPKNNLSLITGQANNLVENVINGYYDVVIKNTKETYTNKLPNNLSFQNSFLLKDNLLKDKLDGNLQNNVSPIVSSLVEKQNTTNVIKLESVLSSEALASGIGKNKDKDNVGEIFNLGINLVDNKTKVFDANNKIIEVSDKSSEIKNNVLSQVEDKITFMAKGKEGMQEVTMQLHPKNLGKVNVKMSMDSEKINVEIMALDQKTGSILMSNVHELTKALQSNLNNGTVTVTVTEGGLNQYNQGNLNYSQQHNNKERSYNNQNIYNGDKDIEDVEEGNIIAEMMNLRNLKLNKVV